MSTSAGPAGPDHGRAVRGVDDDPHGSPTRTTDDVAVQDRRTVIEREKEEHGGVKIGAAFFGFLSAVGVGVLLTALLTAAGTAVGVATDTKARDVTSTAAKSAATVGIVGGIVLLAIVFIAYYCGGYVAGRMARFNGAKQGFGVWVWALVIAIVLAVLGTIAGDEYNVLSQLNSFPRIPVSEGDLTTGGIIALVALLAASFVGAIVGGLAGMRFHRRVDRTGLDR